MLRFVDMFGRWEASELSQLDAAELFGIGERTSAAGAAAMRRKAKPVCWTAESARCRGSEFRWVPTRKWRRCIGRGIRASRRGISTSIWCAITDCLELRLDEGIPAKIAICWRRRRGAVRSAPAHNARFAVKAEQQEGFSYDAAQEAEWPQ
jgi:hypothetical protein